MWRRVDSEHPSLCPTGPTTPEFRFQSASQRENDSLTVSRPLFLENLTANAVANTPIKQRKSAIHGSRDLLPTNTRGYAEQGGALYLIQARRTDRID
jgi:hypothetical protein